MYFATATEMERLDELAVSSGLEIRQMMELAGWHMLSVFQLSRIARSAKVVVVCGKGNKGGDGMAAARHLANHGRKVDVVLLSKELSPDAQHQLNILRKMNVSLTFYSEAKEEVRNILDGCDIVIDALIGYHLKGAPRDDYKEIIEIINSIRKGVISYDIPTGIDATTGDCYEPCIKADVTLALALPKKAFQTKQAKILSGNIFLADIGIPSDVYNGIHSDIRPEFGENSLLKI